VALTLLLLNPYVDAILVIALGICIGGILNALTPYIEKIPWVGGAIAHAVKGMTQAITHACGVILSPISDAVGGTLHGVSRLVDWTYGQFRRHAKLLLEVALLVTGLAFAVAALRVLVHRLSHSHTGQAARIKTLEREYRGIEHQVKTLEREYHGIDATGIRQRLGVLDKEIATITDTTIPKLRTRVATDEGAFAGLEEWLGIKTGVSAKTWAIAFATTLLAAVGLGGLRCSNFTNLLRKWGCGLGSLLDALLGLAISAIALENVCRLLPILETAFGGVVGPVTHLLTEVPLGGCETPPGGWAKLSVAVGPLPPPQALGSFPV